MAKKKPTRQPTLTEAEQVRDDIRNDLTARLREKFQTVEGGELDGTSILSAGNFDDVVAAYFDEYELPLPTIHAAEVQTPGRVRVAMVCPNCATHQENAVRVTAKLTMEGFARKLTVAAKAPTLDHVCGQQPLPMEDEVGTEPAFDVGDITGTDE